MRLQGAPIRISASDCEGVLDAALAMLEGRRFVERRDGPIRARPQSLDVLNYYVNSIARWRRS